MADWDTGSVLLAVVAFAGSIAAAWLTARGVRSAATVNAAPALAEGTNSRIELLLAAYDRDRKLDDAKIAALQTQVEKQGKEIDELKAKLPRYRAYIRKLRAMIETLHGDPGAWPADLE